MLSANFFNSNYILEHEVKEGIKQVSTNENKKILCVIVRDFIGLDNLEDFLKDKLITDTQEAIKKLSKWQYLPYDKTEDIEEIIPLERYKYRNKAYKQITEKILKALK